MKLYLHYEGPLGPDHTYLWKAADDMACKTSCEQILASFIADYVAKYPSAALVEQTSRIFVSLRDEDGVLLPLDSYPIPLSQFFDTNAVGEEDGRATLKENEKDNVAELKDGSDLEVAVVSKLNSNNNSSNRKARGIEDLLRLQQQQRHHKNIGILRAIQEQEDQDRRKKQKEKEEAEAKKQEELQPLLQTAAMLAEKKSMRKARELWRQILQKDRCNVTALRALAQLDFDNGRFESALRICGQLCSPPPSSSSDDCIEDDVGKCKAKTGSTIHWSKGSLSSAPDLLLAGKCLGQLGRKDEAQDVLEIAMLKAEASPASKAKPNLINDIDIALGWAAVNLGEAEEANRHFMDVLSRTKESNVAALAGYGTLAVLVNQSSAAITPLLRAIVMDKKNKEIGRLLAKILSSEEGRSELHSLLPGEAAGPSVFAFLATTVKDYGAVDAACALLQHALKLEPTSASYALNLVHAHEICQDYIAAFKVVKSFLKHNAMIRIGSGGDGGGSASLSCEDVLRVLEPMKDPGVAVPAKAEWKLQWVEEAPDSEQTSYAVCAPWIDELDNGGGGGGDDMEGGDVLMELDTSAVAAAKTEAAEAAAEATVRLTTGDLIQFNADTLDLLALLFTCVKVLYLRGALAVIPTLVRLIEPVRRRAKTPLHKTSVRNEQAYYTCIVQLLAIRMAESDGNTSTSTSTSVGGNQLLPDIITRSLLPSIMNPSIAPFSSSSSSPSLSSSSSSSSTTPRIYVCGDSHTLPPAWHTIMTAKGQQLVMYPALVTGLKHWHLRPQSDFYPKTNFFKVMNNLPEGATVIFLFGEIDCREGILLAVEKCRYETVEQGMRATVEIFIDVAKELVKKKKLKCLVHPVAPVLDETRDLVKAYNRILQERVTATDGLQWLDCFEAMLSPDGQNLRADLKLDGAHLHPRYVNDLAVAIQKLLQ